MQRKVTLDCILRPRFDANWETNFHFNKNALGELIVIRRSKETQ